MVTKGYVSRGLEASYDKAAEESRAADRKDRIDKGLPVSGQLETPSAEATRGAMIKWLNREFGHIPKAAALIEEVAEAARYHFDVQISGDYETREYAEREYNKILAQFYKTY
jgi:hypothetical protein